MIERDLVLSGTPGADGLSAPASLALSCFASPILPERVLTGALADWLGLAPADAQIIVRELVDGDLVAYDRARSQTVYLVLTRRGILARRQAERRALADLGPELLEPAPAPAGALPAALPGSGDVEDAEVVRSEAGSADRDGADVPAVEDVEVIEAPGR